MSDLKRMEAALLNAEKAGDVEAARLIATEMRRALQASNPSLGAPEPVRLGRESMGRAIKETVKGESRPAQVYAGAGGALAMTGHGLNTLLGDPSPAAFQNWKALAGPENQAPQSTTNADVQDWRSLITASPDTIGGNLLGNAALFGALPARTGLMRGRAGVVADTAVTGGATNYASTPGTSAERARDAMFATVLAPVAPALYAIGSGGRQALTKGGKQVAVGEGVLTEVSPKAEELISQLRAAPPNQIGSFSAAMKTENPTLQVLESGSRTKRGDLWKPFDRENAKSRWDSLVARAGTPEELDEMRSALNKKTGDLREQALTDAQLTTIFSQAGDVRPEMLKDVNKKIADLRFNKRPNKDVQTLLNYVEGELKQGVTPGQLYEVRKTLTDGITPGRTDELSNAIKSARVDRVEFVKQIDEALDTLSGGGWKEYLKKHSDGSKPIDSKQALQDIVGSLERGMPTGIVPPVMGDAPGWKTVGTLRDRFGTKELGSKQVDKLLPEDRQLVDSIVDHLKRQADAMGAGKATLGSPTASLLANTGRVDAVTRNIVENGVNKLVPGGDFLASKVFDKLGKQAEEQLARLLQDPNALAEAIASAMNARRIREASSRLGGASAAGYTGNANVR